MNIFAKSYIFVRSFTLRLYQNMHMDWLIWLFWVQILKNPQHVAKLCVCDLGSGLGKATHAPSSLLLHVGSIYVEILNSSMFLCAFLAVYYLLYVKFFNEQLFVPMEGVLCLHVLLQTWIVEWYTCASALGSSQYFGYGYSMVSSSYGCVRVASVPNPPRFLLSGPTMALRYSHLFPLIVGPVEV